MRNVTGSVFPLFVLLTLTLACGGVKTQSAAKVKPAEEIITPKLEPGEIVLEGRLERTVEKGGWVLKTETQTYLLLAVESFRDESWFKEGARVRAIGQEVSDMVTIFMQGTPFRVRELGPIDPEARIGSIRQAATRTPTHRSIKTSR